MRWQGGRRGGNIDDRRGVGGGAMAGGGIGVVILAAIGYFVFDIDPMTTTQLASQFGGVGVSEGRRGSPTDQAGAFVDVIGANIDDVWQTRIQGHNTPTVTLYEYVTPTAITDTHPPPHATRAILLCSLLLQKTSIWRPLAVFSI